MKDWRTILILALALVIVLMILFQPTGDDYDSTVWQEEIERLNQREHVLKERESKRASQYTADSLQFTQTIDSLQRQGKTQRSLISRLKKNPIVIRVRDSIPEIDALLVFEDSLTDNQDETIALQGRYIDSLHVEIAGMKFNFEERLRLTQQAFQESQSVIQDQRKTIRRERRKTKLFKVLSVVGTVGGILLGGSL